MESFNREEYYKTKHNHYYEEEYATEIMPVIEDDFQPTSPYIGVTFGILGSIIVIASFFMYPIILGLTGVITGFISYNRGAKSFGTFVISFSILSLLLAILFLY